MLQFSISNLDSESDDAIKLEVSDDEEDLDINLPNVINMSKLTVILK